jgi:hypothetical protein
VLRPSLAGLIIGFEKVKLKSPTASAWLLVIASSMTWRCHVEPFFVYTTT